MYFAIGWPKILNIPELGDNSIIKQVICNRDKTLFAILTNDTLSIWYCKVDNVRKTSQFVLIHTFITAMCTYCFSKT